MGGIGPKRSGDSPEPHHKRRPCIQLQLTATASEIVMEVEAVDPGLVARGQELAAGANPDAIKMAKNIIATQSDEIDQMKQLLEHL